MNTNNFGNQFAPGLYSCVMIWLIIAIVCYIVLSRTQAGNWIYSTGGNLSAAKANGVPTDKVKVSLFMFSAFCATVFAIFCDFSCFFCDFLLLFMILCYFLRFFLLFAIFKFFLLFAIF